MLQPVIRTFVLADLKCYMCGATAGSIERERGSSTPRVAIERAGKVRSIGSWETSRLRCPRCGGSVYVDQVEIVDRRTEARGADVHRSGWSNNADEEKSSASSRSRYATPTPLDLSPRGRGSPVRRRGRG
jgi:hypothetical protein